MNELRQSPDEEMQRQLAAGNYDDAFERLAEHYKEKVFRLCVSMLRNEAQAEDMAQEVFVRIWKALPGFHGESSLSTWIYAISRNRCLTELRKQGNRPTVSFEDPEGEAALEHFGLEQADSLANGADLDIEWMLGQLSEKYRPAIMLFYLEQRSYEEVGAMLGIPVGTVKTFLHRGKKELLRIGRRQPIRSRCEV